MNKKEKDRRVEIFINEFNRLIEYFGIYDWGIYFEEDKTTKKYRAYIQIEYLNSNIESNGQIVEVCYAKFWIENEEVKEEEIKEVAFHEVLELILNRLRNYGSNTSLVISEREIDSEVHRIIRIFENRIYKKGLI